MAVDTVKKNIVPLRCPICGVETNYIYRIRDKDDVTIDWYRCQCGVGFQEKFQGYDVFNSDYTKRYDGDISENIEYPVYLYAPIIEELTYGRMFLDVGFATQHTMKAFEQRGWLTWGIDINSQLKAGKSIYKGDFTTYNFSPHVKLEELKKFVGEGRVKDRTFDLIWMGHSLECMQDPITALNTAYKLLSDTGVLYVSVPDLDFINKTGTPGFPYWKRQEVNTLWTERAIVRELERVGFKVVLKRRNFHSRYASWYDIHCICQKNYF